MRAALVGPCEWPDSRIEEFANKGNRDAILREIAPLIHGTRDVLLLYYVGHGQLLPGNDLGLALTDTSEDPKLRLSTSLRLSQLRQEMEINCEARIKIVILDCCCSGIATKYSQGPSDLAAQVHQAAKLEGEGTYTWTACGHSQDTFFEPGKAGLTYFTKFLTQTVHNGIAGATERLALADLHHDIKRRFRHLDLLEAPVKPEPTFLFHGPSDEFVFVHNTAETDPVHRVVDGKPTVELDPEPKPLLTRRRLLTAGATSALAIGGATWWGFAARGRTAVDSSTIRASAAVTLLSTVGNGVHSVAFSPDGKTLASAEGDGTAKLWTVVTKALTKTFTHTAVNPWAGLLSLEQVTAFNPEFTGTMYVAFSPDGSSLAVANGDGTISLWNLATGDEKTLPYLNPGQWNSSTTCLAFDPAGGILASAFDSPDCELWNLANQPARTTLKTGGSDWIQSLAFSPSGGILATGTGEGNLGGTISNGVLQLWEPSTGSSLAVLSQTNSPPHYSLAYGADGKTLAALRSDGTVTLWDTETYKNIATLAGPEYGITCITSGPGTLLASGSDDGIVNLWDTASLANLAALSSYTDTVIQCVAISPDGKTVACGGATLTVWAIS